MKILRFVALLLVSALPALAHDTALADPHHRVMSERDLVWETGPVSLPPGSKIAILEGNPSQPGPFTVRLKLPKNYRIPPHRHPGIEHVTVIVGTFSIGKGEVFDRKIGKTLARGGFAVMQPGSAHFAWTRKGAVIQLHGIGPWRIDYVNPNDDPRNRSENSR